jgi:hypothetical protein
MPSQATTVEDYLAQLPEDRRAALSAVRDVIRKNLPQGYEEGMQYGMIGYYVPHSIYPKGYHCDPKQPLSYITLGNQKNHMALYIMCIYGDKEGREWFEKSFAAKGKKLDAGKACVRFKKLDDLPLDVIGEAVARYPVEKYVGAYEKIRAAVTDRKKQPREAC